MTKYSYSQLKELWIQAGGNSVAAAMAAAIAMAESGGRSDATHTNANGTTDRGLWQINSIHGGQSTLDPLANAKAAVTISKNGTTWRPWCTAWSTGACSGTYLAGNAPFRKFLDSGSSTGVEQASYGSTLTAGITNPFSPRQWAEAFLNPLSVWFLYGMMLLIGFALMDLGFVLLFWRTAVGKTIIKAGKNYVGGKVKTARKVSAASKKARERAVERETRRRESQESRRRQSQNRPSKRAPKKRAPKKPAREEAET
jgi:hypothetical protein